MRRGERSAIVAAPATFDEVEPTSDPHPLATIDQWPVPTVAAATMNSGRIRRRGPTDAPFALASVTKPLVSLAVLVAIEEGSIRLDDQAGPPGSTVAHLLAHASGLGTDEPTAVAAVGTRRIYSNAGFEALGAHLEAATGLSMATYLDEAIVHPLGLTSTRLTGSPAHGAVSSVDDLLLVCAELMAPRLLAAETLAAATSPKFAELAGVLPGYGPQDPNPWGLGFEIRGHKSPHWTSPRNSSRTYGHFGRAGTMFWVDPEAGVACVALADRTFGPWAIEAWPELSTAVLTSR